MTTLDPDLLLRAYASGIFPMADSVDAPDVYWVEPEMRGVLPLDAFHLSKSLVKTLKSERFTTSVNHAFERVIDLCAAPAPDRDNSWINGTIRDAILALHAIGHAHSIEVWDTPEGTLVGGLYGVSLGRAFFGESMFSRATDASKVALAHLVARLRIGGFTLLDCQFITPHLASLGATEISRRDYCVLLSDAVSSGASAGVADFFGFEDWAASSPSPALWAEGAGSPWLILQALTQTS